MYKPSTVCVAGAHWDGADMKHGLTHLLLVWCKAKRTFFTLTRTENSPGCDHRPQNLCSVLNSSPCLSNSRTFLCLLRDCRLTRTSAVSISGWLSAVWGVTQHNRVSILNAPFRSPEVMSSSDGNTMAGRQAPAGLQCLNSLMWAFSLPHRPKLRKHNYLETFPNGGPSGIIFCFINHNFNFSVERIAERLEITVYKSAAALQEWWKCFHSVESWSDLT